ncbi:uncharacterized protein [Arachis hypogaea]|uniref:uncharacterized protein n=1 Tax=Arachis hypogaea TaxID=3818 RepID=UPI003B21D90B
MKLSEKLMQPSSRELIGFSGERVPIMGHIWLKTTMGEIPMSKSIDIQYLIVDCYNPYNIILGRPALNIFKAVVSTLHLCVKFPVQENKIATVHADHQEARQCYNACLKKDQAREITRPQIQSIHSSADTTVLADLDPREDLGERPRPMENLQRITLTADDNQCTYIGEALEGEDRAKLIQILCKNADLFAWTPDDMPGISPEVICHKLAIDRTVRPVAQKKRNLGEEKKQAALEETKKLLNAGFIREIRFTTWLCNVVMILMHPEDQSKTAFITEHGNFCYKVMPFGLKNAGATYQRLMDKVFQHQIGRNMEVYVDDMWQADLIIFSKHSPKAKNLHGQTNARTPLLNSSSSLHDTSPLSSVNASNNQAEYEALLAGLKLALQLQIPRITAYCDSSLVVHQIKGEFQVPDWQTPFSDYINAGTIPNDELNLPLFRRRASFYTVLENTLYRRGHSQPLLKCISNKEAKEVMAETHEGVCGNHIGGRALAAKILRTGYYWPTIKWDCINKVKACDNCQKHATLSETPVEELHTIEVSWPFDRWGLDILGPFLKAPDQVKFLLVSIDYFSKWIEAQPLAHITAEKVRSFLWKNIICRFGIPREIISDNGRQFTDHKLATFLTNFNIKHHFSSVEHPQTNGQVESANRIILQGLKKKLGEAKGEWADLIPEILWSYNTSIQSATGEIPFKLVYGAEALIPVEVSIPTLRTELYNQPNNQQARTAELDLVEEERDISAIKQRARKQYLERRHNKRVAHRSFNNGDLILRRTEDARKPSSHGKLAANWEGPFRVLQNLGKGAYKLETLRGEQLPGTWNVSSLREYQS